MPWVHRIGFEAMEAGGYTLRIPIAFDRVMTAARA